MSASAYACDMAKITSCAAAQSGCVGGGVTDQSKLCTCYKTLISCLTDASCNADAAAKTYIDTANKNLQSMGCSSSSGGSSTSAGLCSKVTIGTAVAGLDADGQAKCGTLIAAANAGADTDALKCPCFSKVSKAVADKDFQCYFNDKDKAAGTSKLLYNMWNACQSSSGGSS